MFEDQSQQESAPFTTRTVIAVILLALAVALGVWVLTLVNTAITDEKNFALLDKIISGASGPAAVETPFGKFQMPKEVLTGLAYFILFLFILIPTKITMYLLTGGVSLLKPDLTKSLRRLIESIKQAPPPNP